MAILSACGSDDGGSPPKLVKEYVKNISPFDTLPVKFDSKLVDLDTLGESNVVLNNVKWVNCDVKKPKPRSSGKELCFIGADTTQGGSHQFASGKSDYSIVFKNIKNSDGYKKDSTMFYFSTHTILDREPNNTPEDAGDIESLGKITDGVTFTGIIDKKMGMNGGFPIEDNEDFYKLNLKRGDSISITVSNKNTPLKVRFFGACNTSKNECNDKTDSTTAKNKYSVTLKDTVKTGHLGDGDVMGKVSPFYIDIWEKTNDKSNPYTVTVKKL